MKRENLRTMSRWIVGARIGRIHSLGIVLISAACLYSHRVCGIVKTVQRACMPRPLWAHSRRIVRASGSHPTLSYAGQNPDAPRIWLHVCQHARNNLRACETFRHDSRCSSRPADAPRHAFLLPYRGKGYALDVARAPRLLDQGCSTSRLMRLIQPHANLPSRDHHPWFQHASLRPSRPCLVLILHLPRSPASRQADPFVRALVTERLLHHPSIGQAQLDLAWAALGQRTRAGSGHKPSKKDYC